MTKGEATELLSEAIKEYDSIISKFDSPMSCLKQMIGPYSEGEILYSFRDKSLRLNIAAMFKGYSYPNKDKAEKWVPKELGKGNPGEVTDAEEQLPKEVIKTARASVQNPCFFQARNETSNNNSLNMTNSDPDFSNAVVTLIINTYMGSVQNP